MRLFCMMQSAKNDSVSMRSDMYIAEQASKQSHISTDNCAQYSNGLTRV